MLLSTGLFDQFQKCTISVLWVSLLYVQFNEVIGCIPLSSMFIASDKILSFSPFIRVNFFVSRVLFFFLKKWVEEGSISANCRSCFNTLLWDFCIVGNVRILFFFCKQHHGRVFFCYPHEIDSASTQIHIESFFLCGMDVYNFVNGMIHVGHFDIIRSLPIKWVLWYMTSQDSKQQFWMYYFISSRRDCGSPLLLNTNRLSSQWSGCTSISCCFALAMTLTTLCHFCNRWSNLVYGSQLHKFYVLWCWRKNHECQKPNDETNTILTTDVARKWLEHIFSLRFEASIFNSFVNGGRLWLLFLFGSRYTVVQFC